MIDYSSKVFQDIKAKIEPKYVCLDKYTDAGVNVVIVPSGLHTFLSKKGSVEFWNTRVNLYVYKDCDLNWIRKTFECIEINENFKAVAAELGAKGEIEYRRFTINYKSLFYPNRCQTDC